MQSQVIQRKLFICKNCHSVDSFRSSGGKKAVTDGLFVTYGRCKICGMAVKIVYEVEKNA